MRKILLYGILTIASIGLSAQEQPDLSNYVAYHSLVNPAANGSFDDFSAIVYGRKQWFSIPGAPSRFGVQAVLPVNRVSVGASLAQESIGVHSRQQLFLTYTHRIKFMGEHNIAFGLSPGVATITSNYNKIETISAQDNEFLGSKSIVRPDFNFGIYYFTRKYFAGFSIPSLIKNSIAISNGDLSGKTSITPSYWHYYFLSGYTFNIDNNYSLCVSTLIKKIENVPVDADINLQLNINDIITTGISYRTKREVMVFGSVCISPSVKIGYCFHSYFDIKNQFLSGHEIFISYAYIRSKQATIQSPRF